MDTMHLRLWIFLALLTPAAAAQNYDDIPAGFFDRLAQGQTDEAIDFVYGTNPWLSKNADQITNLKAELAKLPDLVGSYSYHEPLVAQKAGSRYVHLIYLVGFERQPFRFELRLYRPDATWRLQGISFDAGVLEDIERQANEKLSG